MEAKEDPTLQEEGEEIDMSYEEFLIYSARLGEIEDVKECLAEKVDLATVDPSGNTALHMASANGFLDIVLLLLQNGAPVNALNRSKNTPLHWAALNGRNDIISLLIEWKADANIKNEFDRLPIEEALQNGFTDAAEILATVSTLSDDKIYTSIQEAPEEQEGDDKEERKGAGAFEDADLEENDDDDEADKRSIQSEEAIKPEGGHKEPTPQQMAKIAEQRQKQEQVKMEAISSEMKEKFGMQEFDIEIKKIDENQQQQ
ncbi:hypothetical protein FGO68_gene4950 [Halteria grandinella]|uniref:Ankyrin repeat domain-containing protein n=1 Tax=Halteria grandinella TaxID=5974 RepID=A0A8J8NKI6_HALGN|nr:hypothetical protein FGO68_gene4950 [Halteria grandinella]